MNRKEPREGYRREAKVVYHLYGQTGRSINGTQNSGLVNLVPVSRLPFVQISSIFQKTTAKAWTRFQRWLWRNGTRISDLVQWNIWIFRPEKQDYLFRRFLVPGNFPIERPKSRIPFTFQPDFPEILVNGRQPEFNTGEACCLISLLPLRAHWRITCLIAWLFHTRLCLLLSCLPYQ